MISKKGFTIIEVLIAISIFGIVMGSLASASIGFTNWITKSERKVGAIAVVQRAIESLRDDDPAAMPTSGTVSETVASGGRSFVVETSYCQNAAYCTTSARHITVTAKFAGTAIFKSQTVFAQLE